MGVCSAPFQFVSSVAFVGWRLLNDDDERYTESGLVKKEREIHEKSGKMGWTGRDGMDREERMGRHIVVISEIVMEAYSRLELPWLVHVVLCSQASVHYNLILVQSELAMSTSDKQRPKDACGWYNQPGVRWDMLRETGQGSGAYFYLCLSGSKWHGLRSFTTSTLWRAHGG